MMETTTSTTYRCDNCDVAVDSNPQGPGMTGLPLGWLVVNTPVGGQVHLHSVGCLLDWAQDDPIDENGLVLSRDQREARAILREHKAAGAKKTAAKKA